MSRLWVSTQEKAFEGTRFVNDPCDSRDNVMLRWDLSATPLCRKGIPGRVITEGELLALFVGLWMLEDITYEALRRRELVLDGDNLRRLAEVFEYRLPELAREFGDGGCLRPRLSELVGIRVRRSPQRGAS